MPKRKQSSPPKLTPLLVQLAPPKPKVNRPPSLPDLARCHLVGNALVTTSASATAEARAEVFATALVKGVAQANIGANIARAEALVYNEIGVFAEVS